MNKVLLIIQREYLVRVKKKSFILMTFLVPGLVLLMYFIIFLIFKNSNELNKVSIIKVVDESGQFKGKFKDKEKTKFLYPAQTVAGVKKTLKEDDNTFILHIPQQYADKNSVELMAAKKANFTLVDEIQTQMDNIASGNKMVAAGIDTAKLNAISSHISLSSKQITAEGEKDASIGAAYGVGIAGAILIYISLLIYGAQVMRGVIEEKTSRIIEVVVSSVKPFQLMLGKIIGVGAVGLTQFLLWIILTTGVTTIASTFLMRDKMIPAQKTQVDKLHHNAKTQVAPAASESPLNGFMKGMGTVNFVNILSCFIFYFITGYLLYSAMFAAVGSAVDSETETQQFMFPITMPLLFTYILSFAYLLNYPDSSLAVWLSIIPFTAPVAMMVRIPFGVPGWQLALSMIMMIVGFIFTTWVASRIYRVGILMYGKKATYKELSKWFFYKE
jgi:ABC-2 type transport system permease protein